MRVNNWEQILADYLQSSQNIQFEWGQNDCALWASTFADLVNGTSIAEDWRGLYGDEEGANDLMLERGFANCGDIADSHFTSKPLKRASRGDMVMIASGALGICDGRRSYFITPQKGLGAVLTLSCIKAWAV